MTTDPSVDPQVLSEPTIGELDPEDIPGTPAAVNVEALGCPTGYVDLMMRKRVNKQRSRGLECTMGRDFPGCRILIRPWSARAIQVFREKYEIVLRSKNPQLGDSDELDADSKIELNRATANMSVMGLKGRFFFGYKEENGKRVADTRTFANFPSTDDTEGQKEVRVFVAERFLIPFDAERPESADEIDMEFLSLLMRLNGGLSKVTYKELDEKGKNFVYGLADAVDYHDSLS